MVALGVGVAAGMTCVSVTGCSSAQRVATVTITGAGAATDALAAQNRAGYRAATDALIARLRLGAGSITDYDREVAPLNATFYARSEAIEALSAALMACAAIVDLSRGVTTEAARAAVLRVLETADYTLAVLARGAVLPPVTPPATLTSTLAVLRGLVARADAGVPTDGG
jgi:hypothetical protein